MSVLRKYSSFIKIEHTLFSLPLILAGACLADGGWPPLRVVLLIILAATGARVTAMTLNRIIDRDIDRKNPRTKDRHLPAGHMKLWEAWVVVLVGLLAYVLGCWGLNDLCMSLAWLPMVGFAAYPFFKRITKWTHVGLGVVWSFAPVAGYIAVTGSWAGVAPAVVLGVFSIFWLAGFDIIYATQDEEHDRAHRVRSLPAAWGSSRALRAAALFHFLAFVCLVVLYAIWFAGPFTVMLLGLAGLLLIFEQKSAANVDVAFFKINAALGFVVFFFVLSGLKGV